MLTCCHQSCCSCAACVEQHANSCTHSLRPCLHDEAHPVSGNSNESITSEDPEDGPEGHSEGVEKSMSNLCTASRHDLPFLSWLQLTWYQYLHVRVYVNVHVHVGVHVYINVLFEHQISVFLFVCDLCSCHVCACARACGVHAACVCMRERER